MSLYPPRTVNQKQLNQLYPSIRWVARHVCGGWTRTDSDSRLLPVNPVPGRLMAPDLDCQHGLRLPLPHRSGSSSAVTRTPEISERSLNFESSNTRGQDPAPIMIMIGNPT
jgi:hypothetical protein